MHKQINLLFHTYMYIYITFLTRKVIVLFSALADAPVPHITSDSCTQSDAEPPLILLYRLHLWQPWHSWSSTNGISFFIFFTCQAETAFCWWCFKTRIYTHAAVSYSCPWNQWHSWLLDGGIQIRSEPMGECIVGKLWPKQRLAIILCSSARTLFSLADFYLILCSLYFI